MKRFTRLAFRIHSIAGLAGGLLLLVIALSGVALLFEKELDPVIYPKLLQVIPGRQQLPLDTLYARTLATYPGASGLRFRNLPGQQDHSIEMSMYRNTGNDSWEWNTAYIDPYSGNMLGHRDARNSFSASVFGWLLKLHYSLHGGKIGEWLVGLVAVALLFSVITGIFIYRKHVKKVLLFREKLNRKSRRTMLSSLHRIVGVWALLFHLIIGISALQMMWYVFEPDFYKSEKEEAHIPSLPLSRSLDGMYHQLQSRYPDMRVSGISIDPHKDDAYTFSGYQQSASTLLGEWHASIVFDKNGNITKADFPTNKPMMEQLVILLQSLHFGQWGGLVVKIIYSLLGLAPAILSLTGVYLFMRRKHL